MAARLLIVDDDTDDLFVFRDVFSSTVFKEDVKFFQNSKELLPYLESLSDEDLPQLILSDLNMPGQSGLDLLKMIKLNPRLQHIPFILCSTSSHPYDREKGIALGAREFINKPIDMKGYNAIAERVGQLLQVSKALYNKGVQHNANT
jgi:CheY-like chemotaxis protein